MDQAKIAELEDEIVKLKKQIADNDALYGNRHPEIEIEVLREAGEDGGNFMGYFCRGHVDKEAFAWAANYYGDHMSGYGHDPRYVNANDVKHIWWRTVPISGEDNQMQYIPAAEPGRGAWAATVHDSYMTRSWREHRRRMKDYDQGRIRGIEDALLWVVNMFQWGSGTKEQIDRDREIAERILGAWKAYGNEQLKRERDRENS